MTNRKHHVKNRQITAHSQDGFILRYGLGNVLLFLESMVSLF